MTLIRQVYSFCSYSQEYCMSTVYQKQLVIEKETDYILGLNALVCSGYSSHEEHIRVKVKHDIRLAISEVDAHAW